MSISQAMVELDKRRRKCNAFGVIMGGGFFAAFLLVVAYMPITQLFPESSFAAMAPIYMVVLFALSVGAMQMMTIEKKKFAILYKETFVVEILKQNFENVVYTPDKGYDQNTVKNMGLFSVDASFASEDFLQGSYKGVNFTQADVNLNNVKGIKSDSKGRTVIASLGVRMFAFDYPNKEIRGVKVFSNNLQQRSNFSNGIKLNKVSMEDVQFNNDFDVLAASEHEAFYVLTPNMMERIRKICAENGNVAMYIANGKLYLGMNTTRNAFDANIKDSLSFPEEKMKIEKDVQVIKDIIEVMKLV